jgi:hypothetical protein
MGYNYYFLVTVEDTGSLGQETIEEKYFPVWRDDWKRLEAEEEEGWWPSVKETGHTSSGGYGTGDGGRVSGLFRQFTSLHPEITFGLYLIYSDYTNLTCWVVKGNEVLSKHVLDTETIKIGPNSASIHMEPDSFNISNDITYIFGSDYRSEENLDWR